MLIQTNKSGKTTLKEFLNVYISWHNLQLQFIGVCILIPVLNLASVSTPFICCGRLCQVRLALKFITIFNNKNKITIK